MGSRPERGASDLLAEACDLPYNRGEIHLEKNMDKFIIEGGVPLQGEVTPAGNKNAALPLVAACLLTKEPVVLRNIPHIQDVFVMRKLIESLGTRVEDLDATTWRITSRDLRLADLNPDLCRSIRAFKYERGFSFQTDNLRGADFLMDEASVTATENAIMAASMAEGDTIIRNAASEPHVQELCYFLNELGAHIEEVGSNTLHIHGVTNLHGGEFTIGPDYLEVISFVGAAAITRGSIRVKNAGVKNLNMIAHVFDRLGVRWNVEGDDLLVPSDQSLEIIPDLDGAIPEVKTNVWPAFPTDLISIAITVATQAKGSVMFHDWMFSGRMYFTDKLVGMGAKIILCDPFRCLVQGPNQLYGENLESPDIRAGMSMLLAALTAKGKSTVRNISQIERGYQDVDQKLRALGAHIERVSE